MNTSHASGTATDQAGNTYVWNYANHFSVSDSGPQTAFAGEMVDAFTLAGNGPAHLNNGFRALFDLVTIQELTSPRRSDRLRHRDVALRSAVGRRARTEERAPAMSHNGRRHLAVWLIAGLLVTAGCVLAPAMANGPPGRSLDASLEAQLRDQGFTGKIQSSLTYAPRPAARSATRRHGPHALVRHDHRPERRQRVRGLPLADDGLRRHAVDRDRRSTTTASSGRTGPGRGTSGARRRCSTRRSSRA